MEQSEFSWRRLEFVGVSAFVVVCVCLFIGQTAERYADTLAPPDTLVAVAKPSAHPAFNAVDYATTGALKSGTVIIGPCDTNGR